MQSISSRHSSLFTIGADADVHQMQSQAENTIRDYNPCHVAPNRILVKGNDGLLYPKDPDNNYVSRFPDRFRGCLGCGSIDHMFRACPQQSDLAMKQKSHKDLHVITLPPRFWRKKAVKKYDPILYDDVDEDLYVFKSFGKSMTRTPHFVPRPHSDLILWDETIDQPELQRDFHIGKRY